jgi:hypothetical protein
MRHRPSFTAATLCVVLAALIAPVARSQTLPENRPGLSKLKQVQVRMLLERERAEIRRARAEAKRRARHKASSPAEVGESSRHPRDEGNPGAAPGVSEALRQRVHQWRAQAALKANVRANNPAGDLTTNAGQAEEYIAASGSNVLIAWNDGEGFNHAPPNDDIMGIGYSTDGGTSFTDAGPPPKLTNWTWTSDPVVAVNERTGTFYFCGLVDSTAIFNGIGVVPVTFPGGVYTPGTPRMTRKVSSGLLALDKEWIAADSTSDSVYVSYTTYTAGANYIQFQRSADGLNWVAATTLSAPADSGFVQGSRVVTGPSGEVYVVWASIGPVDVDFFNIRKSTNFGVTFGAEVIAPSSAYSGYFGNFGSGAPGFNRDRGITFPSLAVDRSAGANRGHVYLAWNESINFYDDALTNNFSGNISEPVGEVGANDTPGTATLFTVHNRVRGAVGSGDFDYWRFNVTQGQTAEFWVDSADVNLNLAFRLFCSDGLTRLAGSNPGLGAGGIIVFTFPTTGTYYLRCAGFSGSTGGYRIQCAFSTPSGGERSRDHRDVFVASSTNGTAWGAPVRVNTDPAYLDNWLPEVAVSAQGRVYCAWYDWRDAGATTCGGESNIYMSRSDDGGGSWVSLGLISDGTSPWTNVATNIAPNQGDYLALFANDIGVYPAWADGRDGDPNVYTVALPLALTPTQIALVRADAQPDRVSLTWYASGSEGLMATVYRRTAATDWAPLGSVGVPGDGQLAYEDDAVTAGGRYGYRLGITEQGQETFHGEAWVDVPSGAALALRGVQPNPASRDLWVSFSLPSRAPATLSLIDVAGRTVRRREVGSLGAGAQRVNLGEGGPLPAGVYVVQLTQGERTLTSRVSVIR